MDIYKICFLQSKYFNIQNFLFHKKLFQMLMLSSDLIGLSLTVFKSPMVQIFLAFWDFPFPERIKCKKCVMLEGIWQSSW